MRFVDAKDWDGVSEYHYAHLKRDGIWVSLCMDQAGIATSWSRTPRLIDLSWHPTFLAFQNSAPCCTVAYCECFPAEGPRELVKGYIRDHDPNLKLECFAVDTVDGVSKPPSLALDALEVVVRGLGLPFVPWWRMGDLRTQNVDLRAIPAGGEGYMLKDGNTLNWRKVKPCITVDLLCIGFVPGKGKYTGEIGAMRLADATGKEVTQVSGMTDEERKSMTFHPDIYMGQVIEVAAQARGSAGGLMHPRFVAVRHDKTEADLDTLS